MFSRALLALAATVAAVHGATIVPSAKLADGSTITGGTTNDGIEYFKGIRFADPPVGDLRFKPPQKMTQSQDGLVATEWGNVCYLQNPLQVDALGELPGDVITFLEDSNILNFVDLLGNFSEDCLFLNVFRPSGTTSESKLPVMVWIYGGAFIAGASNEYDPGNLMKEARDMNQDVIFVSMNYRLGAFGFLAGEEVANDSDGNWGLMDQRLALEWVADNIANFGGDPDRVTIFGESAGAMSVAHQMIMYDGDHMYNGKPLFQAAIMELGSIIPTKNLSSLNAQEIYNEFASNAGCGDAEDSLACLRSKTASEINDAQNQMASILSYRMFALPFMPRYDGKAITDEVYNLMEQGKYAKVPYIIGDQENEGTFFAIVTANVTTDDDFKDHFRSVYEDMTDEEMNSLMKLYPRDASKGSPFRTGIFNNWYPQFKRIAAIFGDTMFQWPRRRFLQTTTDVKRWSYLSRVQYGLPVLGTFHANDILYLFFLDSSTSPGRTYKRHFIAFANSHDPNTNSGMSLQWPEYSEGNSNLVLELGYNHLDEDNFRSDQFKFVQEHISHLEL